MKARRNEKQSDSSEQKKAVISVSAKAFVLIETEVGKSDKVCAATKEVEGVTTAD